MQERRAPIHDWPLAADKALKRQRFKPCDAEKHTIYSYNDVAIVQRLHSPPRPLSMLLHSRTEFEPLAVLHLHNHG